jgi:pimeloyl-ACP methyl ester carboxylesterase
LAVPALVGAGEFDLQNFRLGAEEPARLLPEARSAVLPGAGHLAPLETPELFGELVVDFIR